MEKEIDPAPKLSAVVDVNEVNEIDRAAGALEAILPMMSAVVEESKEHEDTRSAVSITKVLAMLGGALAAAWIFRVVWA